MGGHKKFRDVKEIIKNLAEYPDVIKTAGADYSPAVIANYVYELCKNFNSFWQSVKVLPEEDSALRNMRLHMSHNVAKVIKSGTHLLGINVPQRM